MGRINVLSFAVANLIAAGEVVDRPSSVIKELLENAIDSGATSITVEIQNGGVTYMRVSDNGCGIEPDDLPVAIRRHATSKIKNAEDLDGILTLGFRGEALAAIASVSDMRIISKTRGAAMGAMLKACAGNILGVTERAAAEGTTVIVENLFANVPARRKFLKKDVTEAMAVSALVEKIALSKPDISFKLIVDGNQKLDTIGDGNLKNTVYSVFGREFSSKLIPTALEVEGIGVEGFIGRSDNVRANRNYQNFFINGRYVKSKTACAALEQAFTSYIPPEKFPCCVLFLNINPKTVDVNVHPAKLEVKFSNEKPVFEAIYYAVRNALEQSASRPDVSLSHMSKVTVRNESAFRGTEANMPIEDGRRESLKARQVSVGLFTAPPATERKSETVRAETVASFKPAAQQTQTARPQLGVPQTQNVTSPVVEPSAVKAVVQEENTFDPGDIISADEYLRRYIAGEFRGEMSPEEEEYELGDSFEPENDTKPEEQAVQPVTAVNETAQSVSQTNESGHSLDYRIIGEAFNAYVIVERGDVMLLIDKHAAHERIIFEQLRAGLDNAQTASQMLMLPLEIMMTSDEIHTIGQYRDEIEAIGFELTTGKYTVSITAIPEGISTDAVSDMLVVMAERLKSGTGTAGLTRDIIFERALYQASCKAAIKAGREYSPEHIKWIVGKLMEIPDITVCPHGRPVAMELSKKNLDRQFERT